MKTKHHQFKVSILGLILISFTTCVFSSCQPSEGTQNKKTTNISKDSAKPDLVWFREAKFGMFIHWGPYSRLAGEWNGRRQTQQQSEWIMKYLKIPVKDYRELAHKLNPVKFDAKAWVKLAKATGMKYIVITAKHHDGFAMYHSKVTDYNIYDWTPFKRDPLKELSEACAEEGIKFCIYYSHREDWDHPGAYGNDWDYDNDLGEVLYSHEKFNKYLEEKAKPQLRELLTNYGPIGLVWFDRGMYTQEQGMDFVKMVHELQPACLANSRVGNIYNSFESIGDYQCANDKGMPMRGDPSKSFPAGGLGAYWEAPQTLNESWGFNKFDNTWKSPEAVIKSLAEIASRGGNFLLNIGPNGEGEIPPETVDIFNKVGPWVQRNGESIYGTSANLFPDLSWGFTTVKGNNIYLFVRDWPTDGKLNLPGLKNVVKSAYFLTDKSSKIPYKQVNNTIALTLPKNPTDHPLTVLVLEIEGTPSVDPPVLVQDTTGVFKLNYLTAIMHGKAESRFNVNLHFHITGWQDPGDATDWIIQVNKPGVFRVSISYGADKSAEGKPFEVTDGSTSLKSSVLVAGDYQFHDFPLGYFNFPKPGRYTLTLKPTSSGNTNLMFLNSITLIPVNSAKKDGWGVN